MIQKFLKCPRMFKNVQVIFKKKENFYPISIPKLIYYIIKKLHLKKIKIKLVILHTLNNLLKNFKTRRSLFPEKLKVSIFVDIILKSE